jgi:hypothetical protein
MPPRPSIARELFEQIQALSDADRLARLKSMVNSDPPTFETEHLDFKGFLDRGSEIDDKVVRKIWSEALAGFATTAGGLLIWGIDARPTGPERIDAAGWVSLVPNPHALRSRLQELQHQATDPPIPGIEYLAVPDPESDGAGFLVCFIPESDYKPHRSESGGKRWVMRIGDSFRDVPPPILRALFSPNRRSYVLIRVARTDRAFGPNGGTRARYSVELHNEGPSTAGELLLYIQGPDSMGVSSTVVAQELPNKSGWRIDWGQSLHPGDSLLITQLFVESTGNVTDLTLGFHIHTTDQVPYRYTLTIPASSEAVHEALPEPFPPGRFS